MTLFNFRSSDCANDLNYRLNEMCNFQYMKKQTAALREVNDSRLKIYEQLEVSVQNLERANHRLVVEKTSDKKLIRRYVN